MKLLAPLSKVLLPHKDRIGAVAGVVTVLQFFSGAFLCNDIRKSGSSKGFPLIPFLGGAVLSAVFIQFGIFIGDDATVKVNLIGFALSVVYSLIYYFYTPNADKGKVWGKFGLGGALAAGLIAYAQYEDPKVVVFRFGIILTVMLLSLIGSPLLDLPRIVRDQSTEGLPFPIIFAGTLVSLSWLTYGIALNDDFMIVQNVAASAISLVQLSLFLIYPSKKQPKAGKKKPAKKTN